MARLAPHRSWPELVMHVLAHVPSEAAASVYDARYVAYAQERLGPAGERPLGEDAAVLSRTLASHQALAQAQIVAWLFDEVADAVALADVDIGALPPAAVCRPWLLPMAMAAGPAAELLRCAALLEQEALEALGPVRYPREALAAALEEVAPAAPRLARMDLLALRALRLRGRVLGDEIWVGAPCEALGLGAEHAAWQAAHEATVAEIAAEGGASERGVERIALCLLAARARAASLEQPHAAWLRHLAEAPCDPSGLSPPERRLFDQAWLRSGT